MILATAALGCQQQPAAPDISVPELPPRVLTAPEDIESFLSSLSDEKLPSWDERRALELVALPLSCVDRPHARSKEKGYLHERTYTVREDYEESLAFYGCSDWHSAVNSTWTMTKVLKDFPDLAVGKLIREKLDNHLSKKSLEGELAFFKEAAGARFERPYGWAWLMKLYTELATWDDPDANQWAENLAPLARLLAERTLEYLEHLSYPMRIGTHGNTAFSLTFMLEYARTTKYAELEKAIVERSQDFFGADTMCPLPYEPSGSDFFSPCLAEAVLMSEVLSGESYLQWLHQFMPPVASAEFQALATPVEVGEIEGSPSASGAAGGDEEEPDDEARLLGAKSHLIGLSFYRAAALKRIARSLGEDDPRQPIYERLAALHGNTGFASMFAADYVGTHWLATYAVYMLTA